MAHLLRTCLPGGLCMYDTALAHMSAGRDLYDTSLAHMSTGGAMYDTAPAHTVFRVGSA